MKILQKYYLTELLKHFFSILLFFLAIFALSEFFWRLPDFLHYKPSITVITQFLFLHIPLWCVQTLPLTTMLSTTLTISNFNYNRELLMLSTSGVDIKKFFLSWLFVGLVVSIISFYLNDQIATKFFRKAQDLFYTKVKRQVYSGNVVENLFYHTVDKTGTSTYFFIERYVKETNKIHNFILTQYNETGSKIYQIYAREGKKQNLQLTLYNCIIRDYTSHKLESEKTVDNYIYLLPIDLEEFKYDYTSIQLDQLNLNELKLAIKILQYKNEPDHRIRTEISFRYAIAFLNFILILLSIALGKISNSQGRLKCFVYVIIAVIIYWFLLSFTRLLGESGVINPYISVWIANILFLLTGIVLYFQKEYLK